MQTAIGQGNTLVSPMHMALITSAIANDGLLMKPYLIDKVTNAGGDTIRTTEPTDYKRLMTSNEAALLGKLMEGVVQNGTASALNGRGYTVAGKTGSAEYDENGSSHSWFIGYSNVDKPDLVVAIIVEGGGTGSEAAVPIAADLMHITLIKCYCSLRSRQLGQTVSYSCQLIKKELYYNQFEI